MRFSLLLLLLASLLVPAAAAAAEELPPGPGCRWSVPDDGWVFDPPASLNPLPPDPQAKPLFKGVEVYAWLNPAGRWRYTILPGTNRLKSRAEVLATEPGRVLSTRGLEFRLREMPPGETVTLLPLPLDPPLALSPRTLRRLQQVAEVARLQFEALRTR